MEPLYRHIFGANPCNTSRLYQLTDRPKCPWLCKTWIRWYVSWLTKSVFPLETTKWKGNSCRGQCQEFLVLKLKRKGCDYLRPKFGWSKFAKRLMPIFVFKMIYTNGCCIVQGGSYGMKRNSLSGVYNKGNFVNPIFTHLLPNCNFCILKVPSLMIFSFDCQILSLFPTPHSSWATRAHSKITRAVNVGSVTQ